MQKSKKEKRKIFHGTFYLKVFLFPVTKRAEKVSGSFFFVRGEGKCEINYKKRRFFFSPLGIFSPFLVVRFPEKMIRKCFGGKEKE